MKRLLPLLLACMLILPAAGCSGKGDKHAGIGVGNYAGMGDGVEMPELGLHVWTNPSVFSFDNLHYLTSFDDLHEKHCVMVLIKNTSDKDVVLSQAPNVCVLDGEEWKGVPFKSVDYHPSVTISPHQTHTTYFGTDDFTAPGTYRLFFNTDVYGEVTIIEG